METLNNALALLYSVVMSMNTILSDINGTTSPASIAGDFMEDFLSNGESYLSRAEPKALAIYESIKSETGLQSPKDVLEFIKAELKRETSSQTTFPSLDLSMSRDTIKVVCKPRSTLMSRSLFEIGKKVVKGSILIPMVALLCRSSCSRHPLKATLPA